MITTQGFKINLSVNVLLLLIVISIIICIYKYIQIKNRDFRINILNNVYAPLYMLVVRQEIYRKILEENLDIEEYPVLEYMNTKQEAVFVKKGVINEMTHSKPISRESFMEALNKVDISLASHRLITLLSMYKGAIELEESLDTDNEDEKDIYLRAMIIKNDIEKDLLKEIIDGYRQIYSKLKIYKASYEDKWYINSKGYIVTEYNLHQK